MKTLRVILSLKFVRNVAVAGLAFLAANSSILAQEKGLQLGHVREDAGSNEAWFNFPQGVAVDSAGNVFVADSYNNVIRKVTPDGVVTTLAGTVGIAGNNDGKGSEAHFYYPQSIAVDASGNLFVADSWNYIIRKITPAGVVSTLAGLRGKPGGADGPAGTAQFGYLSGIAVDSRENVYVADVWNKSVRKVSPEGTVTTLAGSAGAMGGMDGIGREAQFGYLSGLAVDRHGNVYVPDVWTKTIRKIAPTGMVTTLAGVPGSAGSSDGIVSHAKFTNPLGIAVDSAGNVYVADQDAIRKLSPAGTVATLAGCSGNGGIADGRGKAARFGSPVGIAVDAMGNIYVADSGNYAVRKVTANGMVTTLAGGPSGWGSTASLRLASPGSSILEPTQSDTALSDAGSEFP